MTTPLKIAIVGAGPAGLALARLLQKSDITCTIYDLEADRNARTQGGCLDMHEGAAQQCIRECGLYETFLSVARTEGETLKIYEPNGTLIMDEGSDLGERRPDSFKGRPEVDRKQLRDMLIDSLYPGSLQWGHKLKAVTTDPTGLTEKYNLHFEHKVETGFDLVVGADGAWSKVRHLISDVRPTFSGITGVDAKLSNIDTVDPALAKRVGNGMCLTLGCNTTVLSQRNGDGSVKSYGFFRGTHDWHKTCGIDWSDVPKAKADFVRKYYDGFNDDAKNLMLLADDNDFIPRPMYMLPVGHRWATRQGLTLVGDAAHIMTPFAGVGVNVAMEDALSLATQLTQWKKNVWDKAGPNASPSLLVAPVRAYEEEMFPRAEAYAKETMMYFDLFFHERGGIAMCEQFAKAKAEEKAAKEATKAADVAVEVTELSLTAALQA